MMLRSSTILIVFCAFISMAFSAALMKQYDNSQIIAIQRKTGLYHQLRGGIGKFNDQIMPSEDSEKLAKMRKAAKIKYTGTEATGGDENNGMLHNFSGVMGAPIGVKYHKEIDQEYEEQLP